MADPAVVLVENWWQIVLVVVGAYAAYRFDRRGRRRDKREERITDAVENSEQNKRVLQGEDASIDRGVVEIVELHDKELDHHDERLTEAEQERENILERLQGLKHRSEQRCEGGDT